MTMVEVLDRFAQRFGQEPSMRPHGKYRFQGCLKWHSVGNVCVFLVPGGGAFLCGPCSKKWGG